jgi:hypothetical protein
MSFCSPARSKFLNDYWYKLDSTIQLKLKNYMDSKSNNIEQFYELKNIVQKQIISIHVKQFDAGLTTVVQQIQILNPQQKITIPATQTQVAKPTTTSEHVQHESLIKNEARLSHREMKKKVRNQKKKKKKNSKQQITTSNISMEECITLNLNMNPSTSIADKFNHDIQLVSNLSNFNIQNMIEQMQPNYQFSMSPSSRIPFWLVHYVSSPMGIPPIFPPNFYLKTNLFETTYIEMERTIHPDLLQLLLLSNVHDPVLNFHLLHIERHPTFETINKLSTRTNCTIDYIFLWFLYSNAIIK